MLNHIQAILEQEKFSCVLYPATEQPSPARLLVFLGNDYKKREQILEITSQEQQLHKNLTEYPSLTPYHRLQFRILFPFEVKEAALNQVASLILFLNQLLDLPGLELNELNNQVSYRYVWLVKEEGIDAKLVLSLVGTILLIMELFTQMIEYLADGTTTFNELLEEVIKVFNTGK